MQNRSEASSQAWEAAAIVQVLAMALLFDSLVAVNLCMVAGVKADQKRLQNLRKHPKHHC